ncbi:MAG: hypothetical protein HYT88_02125 [Candidatus Omnitrophica bacterium]|nr:hypothetical protein [Candidatus Omnitrophota bacterium]MBI3010824.1 hypothetical protein [Candidatus Omnitrophota bacterium]
MRKTLQVITETFHTLVTKRRLWIPFVFIAILEAALAFLIWLSPHPPFSKVLAPPLRYFFSDRILHYPAHLWFLYHAMKHVHLVAAILAGAFLSGVACVMTQQAYQSKKISFRQALISNQVRFVTVTLVWILSWGLGKLAIEMLGRLVHTTWVSWAMVAVALLLQALLVFAIPAVVFEKASWWKALLLSVQLALRRPLSALWIAIPPSALVIGFSVVASPIQVGRLMDRVVPEIVFAFITARLLVWAFADAFLTVSASYFWLRKK